MLNDILSRWARRRAASLHRMHAAASDSSQVSTGRSGPVADTLWQSILRWMPGDADPWAAASPPPHQRSSNMPAARAEFEACLRGLDSERIADLQRSIRRSRSLRDLWHLRTWLYTEVARSFSQGEAEQRLQQLKPFFQNQASLGGDAPVAARQRH